VNTGSRPVYGPLVLVMPSSLWFINTTRFTARVRTGAQSTLPESTGHQDGKCLWTLNDQNLVLGGLIIVLDLIEHCALEIEASVG